MQSTVLRWLITGVIVALVCPVSAPARSGDLTGLYELYVQGDEARGIVGYMRISAQPGNSISASSASASGAPTDEWKGRGAMQGNSGSYSWRFRDGRTGETSFTVDSRGNLRGQVRGSGINWNYVALRALQEQPASGETWRLTRREFPVLGQAVVHVTEGRNAGSSIKVQRTGRQNEVNYIDVDVVRGQLECRKVSTFRWSETVPETILPGQEVSIQLEAGIDLAEGSGCGSGRISVSYGSRNEPLRDRAANIVDNDMLAIPNTKPHVTEIFRVYARPDLPANDMFTVAIHVDDGGVTDEVVALYVYEKVKRY
jgi:hypothetical protein